MAWPNDEYLIANADAIRMWRGRAHREFDKLWLSNAISRRDAYYWLADQLGVFYEDCHIGNFGIAACQRVVRLMYEARREGYGMSVTRWRRMLGQRTAQSMRMRPEELELALDMQQQQQ